jgi:protease-4
VKKFLIGLVAGFLLAGLACVIAVFTLARFGDRTPSVPSEATLVMRLGGSIPEIAPTEIPLPMFESQAPSTVADIWHVLRKAESDSRVKALVLQPRGVGEGWAKMQEIREMILRFRKSGKPVYAYLRTPRAKDYYLATAADKVYLTPEDFLDVKGMRAEVEYYRRTLDKIGVVFEIEHAGKYKDAMDTFTRDSMSPETRQVLDSVLDILYAHLVESIASGRKKSPDQVRAALDDGPLLAKQALDRGLVDGLKFEDQVFDELKSALKQKELKRVSHRDYARASQAPSMKGTRVALVVGQGEITRGGGGGGIDDDEGIRSGAFGAMVRSVASDDSVKGVVLRIDSPGGDAVASEEILHEVRELSRKKPLVLSMSDVAASGGYYIAMTGDPVVAYPGTFTGSIGVIYGKVNLAGLYDKLGIRTEILKRGRNADIDSFVKPLDEAARRKLRDGIDSTYRAFLDRVAEGRKRKAADIEPLAQGRVWLGAQAKANGLVDELGGLDKAFELLRQRMKVDAKEPLVIALHPRRKSLFEQIFGSNENPADRAARREVRSLARRMGLPDLDPGLWGGGGIMARAPFQIRVE